MWCFGFGSLMWGGWEQRFAGTRVAGARLLGYRREFNKASWRNWGSKECPGPTLGLCPSAGDVVVGVAFEFPEIREAEVLGYLRSREGASFALETASVELPGLVQLIAAVVPMNTRQGKTYIGDLPLLRRAEMARVARGTSGTCVDYAHNVQDKLLSLGIHDPTVEAFLSAMDAIK